MSDQVSEMLKKRIKAHVKMMALQKVETTAAMFRYLIEAISRLELAQIDPEKKMEYMTIPLEAPTLSEIKEFEMKQKVRRGSKKK